MGDVKLSEQFRKEARFSEEQSRKAFAEKNDVLGNHMAGVASAFRHVADDVEKLEAENSRLTAQVTELREKIDARDRELRLLRDSDSGDAIALLGANTVLRKRVAELEAQLTEQRAVPIPIGLGEVCVSECHDGDGVLREMVIHTRRGDPCPVGTPLPDGYVGLPLPSGEILARIRVENADGARLGILDSLERCINAAYAAEGKPPLPLRADLQAQLAWTPVSAGLPTEPGLYEFTDGTCTACYELEDGRWFGNSRGQYTMFRRIELPKGGES